MRFFGERELVEIHIAFDWNLNLMYEEKAILNTCTTLGFVHIKWMSAETWKDREHDKVLWGFYYLCSSDQTISRVLQSKLMIRKQNIPWQGAPPTPGRYTPRCCHVVVATEAGSAYPTGMLSCLKCCHVYLEGSYLKHQQWRSTFPFAFAFAKCVKVH